MPSTTEITVEISPIPIELISGRTNAEPWKIPEKFAQDHWLGQKLPSVRLVGALNASAISHQIGNSVQAMVIALAAAQLTFRLVGIGRLGGRAGTSCRFGGGCCYRGHVSVAPMRYRARRCRSP